VAASERDDMGLLSSWRAGDKDAGRALLERHFRGVFAFFRSKVGQGASDLAQQTFLDAVEARDRIDERRSFRAYLFGIARNRLFTHFRGEKWATLPFGEQSVEALTRSPSAVWAEQEQQRLLLTALRRLPLDHQIAVELFYWEGLSGAEIAEVLGIAPGTVRSRLTRAREALRDELGRLATSPEALQSTLTDLERWARSLRAIVSEPDSQT
jgi:RNA polymerase sigma-70 factor (ECF subfamily)